MCHRLGDGGQSPQLIAAKSAALANSVAAGGAADDLKRIAGDVYVEAKRLFPAQKLGSDKRAFMTGVCAPLITPGTTVYGLLRRDVFGE